MRPVLFTMGGVPVWSHSVFAALGIVVALALAGYVAWARGRATLPLLWVLSGGLVGGALFAKFGMAGRYLLEAHTPSVVGFLAWPARSLLGGLAGAYAGVVLTKKLVGYPGHTGDLLTPGVALGIAIGRIGCFLAETPGTATSLPWGVRVPLPVPPTVVHCGACAQGLAMHPSFAYESLALLVLAAWSWPYARQGRFPMPWMGEGDLFKLFLLSYAALRFVLEFVRGNPMMFAGLSGSQLTVLAATVLLTWRLMRTRRAAGSRAALA